jgi:hypothetical protein
VLWSTLGALFVGLVALLAGALDAALRGATIEARLLWVLPIALGGGLIGWATDSLLNVAIWARAGRGHEGENTRPVPERIGLRGSIVRLVASLLGGLAALGLAAALGWSP